MRKTSSWFGCNQLEECENIHGKCNIWDLKMLVLVAFLWLEWNTWYPQGRKLVLAHVFSWWLAASKAGKAWRRGLVKDSCLHYGSQEVEKEGSAVEGDTPPGQAPSGPLPTRPSLLMVSQVQCSHDSVNFWAHEGLGEIQNLSHNIWTLIPKNSCPFM